MQGASFYFVGVEILLDMVGEESYHPPWKCQVSGGAPGLQNRCTERPFVGGFDSRALPSFLFSSLSTYFSLFPLFGFAHLINKSFAVCICFVYSSFSVTGRHFFKASLFPLYRL